MQYQMEVQTQVETMVKNVLSCTLLKMLKIDQVGKAALNFT